MVAAAQVGPHGVVAATGWKHFAQFVFTLVVGHQINIYWAALGFLICLSAAAGAITDHFFRRAGGQKTIGRATVGELEMLRAIVANLPDQIYVKDMESRFLMANQGSADAVGATSIAEVIGKTDYDFFPKTVAAGFFEDERKVMLSGQRMVNQEELIENRFGQPRWNLTTKVPLLDSAGRAIGIIGIGRDITDMKEVQAELQRAQEALKFKAEHDYLTSLLNRGAIVDELTRELARGLREHSNTAVMLGDVDHFKNINDIYGHLTGDEVLREVANRLLRTVRAYDLVGRYGGEEFLVVLPGCAAEDAIRRADQMRGVIEATPIRTIQAAIPVTISIGVLVAQDWGLSSPEEVLREVDTALYAAKAAGRNRCSFAVPSIKIRPIV